VIGGSGCLKAIASYVELAAWKRQGGQQEWTMYSGRLRQQGQLSWAGQLQLADRGPGQLNWLTGGRGS
jgi:hypothetical protein